MGSYRIPLRPDLKIEQLVKEMVNTSESQIIIEVPEECSLLTNEINLRLLKFYAEEEEKEIIINAVNPVLLSLAQRLGLSTIRENELTISEPEPEEEYPDSRYQGRIETAAVPESKTGFSKKATLSQQARLFPAVLVLLFTLVVAVWWFLQPKAVVMVYPKEQNLNFTATAQVSTTFNDADISLGKIPAKILDGEFKVATQTATTGYKTVGMTPAVGKILLINSTNQPVLIPKGTILTGRNGIRFLTDKEVLVPKKSTKYNSGVPVGEDYGRTEVTFTAEKKGTMGNQPAKAITRIEDKYQRFLQVVNLAPTSKGSDKKVPVVTLDDVKKGEAEARQQMQMAITEEAKNLISQDFLFLPELTQWEVIRIVNSPEIGEEGGSVQTQLEYRVYVLAPTTVGITKFLNGQFDRSIPPDFAAKDRRIRLLEAKVTSLEAELAGLELTGEGRIQGVLDQRKIKRLIAGKTIAEAKQILTGQNEIADLQFRLENHGSRLPSFDFQIKLLFPAGFKSERR